MKKPINQGRIGSPVMWLLGLFIVLIAAVVMVTRHPKFGKIVPGNILFPSKEIPVDIDVATEDNNHDKNPDVYFYRKEGKLFRINSDRNFDGKLDEWIDATDERWQFRKADDNYDRIVDVMETYSEKGTIQIRERDLDRDSKIDFKEFFNSDSRLEHSEQDTNKDEKSDVWKYYRDGRLERREIDANFDGKPDRWQEFSDGGEVSEEKLDIDFDGKVDKEKNWSTAQTESSLQVNSKT